jgi:hypothetical protein
MKTSYSLVLALVAFVGLMATPANAQVNIDVRIGQPPPVVVYSPPTMVLLPEPQMYVAVGVPYDIFFVSGRYYYLHEGRWFWGPRYGGPWTVVAVDSLPPGLRKFKVKRLHELRDREYKVYKAHGRNFKGEYFVAEDREQPGRGRGRSKH